MKKIFSLFAAMLFSVVMFATNTYWYTGDNNSWSTEGTAMEVSADGLYEYFEASITAKGNYDFKIFQTPGVWNTALGPDYVSKGYNSTDITNMNHPDDHWGTDNARIWFDAASTFYIIVYYPNTCFNTTVNPIICASTTLPEEKFYVAGPKEDGWLSLDWNTTDDTYKMTRDGYVYSITINSVSAGDNTHKFKVSCYDWKSNCNWGYSERDEENSKNVVSFADDSNNLIFKAAKAGNVTISFNIKTSKISIVCATPVITFDNEGGEGVASQNTFYGEAAASVTPPTRDEYTFAGYYDGDNGTGNLVINASGAWQASVENFTDDDTKWIVRADQTLYAKWTQDPGASLAAAKSEDINVGETVRLTATATNCEPTSYAFYEGDAVEPLQNGASNIFDYTPTTVGDKIIKVIVSYEGGSVEATHDLALNTPAVALAVKEGSADEIYLEETTTILVATPSNVGAGVTPSYVFTDQAETPVTSASQTATEWTYTPGELGEKTMKVTMTVGGETYTNTVTVQVYKHWTIYVQDALNWGAMYVYSYSAEAHGGWPGTPCEFKQGYEEDKIYVVTLDSKGSMFIVNGGNDKPQTVNLTAADFADGKYYKTVDNSGITLAEIEDPTAIDEVEGAVKAVKRVVNGQLVIERDGKFFNALGAQVK